MTSSDYSTVGVFEVAIHPRSTVVIVFLRMGSRLLRCTVVFVPTGEAEVLRSPGSVRSVRHDVLPG